MLLGIHILACNEEAVLGRCLQSVQGLADEIVVTDSGSSDRTVEIAKSFGARVVQAAWEDDFAAARNVGLDAARTIWVLVLDADEWLAEEIRPAALRSALLEADGDAFSVAIRSQYGEHGSEALSHDAVRLFRVDGGLRYSGVIHEQLIRPGAGGGTVDGPLCGLELMHDGYLPEVMARKAKAERNLRLLDKALRLEPDAPFHLYNKGVTLCQLNKPKDACTAFALAYLVVPAETPYRAALVRDRAKAMLAIGDAAGASAMLHREVDRYAGYADLHLVYGDSLMAQRRAMDARSAYEAALEAGAASRGPVREAGAGTYRARCGLAAAEAALGRADRARGLYAAAAGEAPRYGPALAGWAEQLHAAGESDEAIREALASSLGQAAPGDAALLARVLGGIGAYAAALPLWREAEPLAPEDVRAYAACSACAGDAAAARAVLLAALGVEHPPERASAAAAAVRHVIWELPLAAELCVDAALCSWGAGLPMGGSLRAMLMTGPKWLADLLFALERAAAPFAANGFVRTAFDEAAPVEQLSFVRLMLERALELGLLTLAGRLKEAAAGAGERYAELLYRHGYAHAAAERLLTDMEQRLLQAEESFCLGEILARKGLLSEALALFEAAMIGKGMQERAHLGSAYCSLALAREALLPWVGKASAAYGGGWPLADVEQIQEALIRLEALGWRTPWTTAQRRRLHVTES